MATVVQAAHAKKESIFIKPCSFQSPLCCHLIEALDAEVDRLYPDWADFPYEGPGNWFDGPPSSDVHAEQTVVWANEDPKEMARAEDRGHLFSFVALSDDAAGRDQRGGDGRSAEEVSAEAVGIVGVKLLPYFPSHWAPGTQIKDPSERSTEADEPVTAEVKRLYVAPAYRGRNKVALVDSESRKESNESVAGLLMQHVEDFARHHMDVQRLVVETGCRQTAAMKFYERSGWTKRKEFGDYTGAGEESGGLSRCYEKWL